MNPGDASSSLGSDPAHPETVRRPCRATRRHLLVRPLTGSARRRVDWGYVIRRAFTLLGAFYAVRILAFGVPDHLQRTDTQRDVVAYFSVMERMEAGDPLYSKVPPGPHVTNDLSLYLYPPFLAAALKLLPPVAFVTFARLWSIPLLLAFWAYAAALACLAERRFSVSGLLIAGLALALFPGGWASFSLGQFDPVLWALFGWAIVLPKARGALLATSMLVKPHALWPLLVAVTRDRARVTRGATAAVVGLTVFAVAVLTLPGFVAACLDWFRIVPGALSQGSWNSANYSLSFAPLRLARLVGWEYAGGPLPWLPRTWLWLAGVGLPITIAWSLRRTSVQMQVAATGCAAVLFAPICWAGYLPICLVPAALWLRQFLEAQRRGQLEALSRAFGKE